MKRIYLDVCALCRPYDDQTYSRIHLETVAIHLILKAIEAGHYTLVRSPVHRAEITAIADEFERVDLLLLLDNMALEPKIDHKAGRRRAEALFQQGFRPADAAHVAFAESAAADFISCDDQLIKRCNQADLAIWTGNPVAFCDKDQIE